MRNVIKQDSKKTKRSLPLTDEDVDTPKKRRKGVEPVSLEIVYYCHCSSLLMGRGVCLC